MLGEHAAAWPEVDMVTTSSVNKEECHTSVREWSPDLVVVSGTGVLTSETIALARVATLNMHHGMLPEIRGMNSIMWALADGRPDWVGVTVHVVIPQLDAGAIVGQARVDVGPDDAELSLTAEATLAGVRILADAIESYARGQSPPPANRDGVESSYRSAPTVFDVLRAVRRTGRLFPGPSAADGWQQTPEARK